MLKHLEISGFKSFAKKSTLDFTSSVTGIVGPNGSGKSNVVEAIRFVLGEQSMKSLRGKSGSDLIFKGSKTLSKLSRAHVSITFNNAKRAFADSQLEGGLKLDFDEVILSREVYADGGNRYLLNGSEVRLKDIHEVLSRVNIGSSGHHIISQGEADRILTSSARDRRGMVEDALGLKIYQYRLKESERKLEKTRANVKEVGLLRREIAPHIQFLKKQVEKIEKAESMRHELLALYQEYFKREETYLKQEKHYLLDEEKTIATTMEEYSRALEESQVSTTERLEEENERDVAQNKLTDIRALIDDLSRKLGRLEGMIEMKEQSINQSSTPQHKSERIVLIRSVVEAIVSDIQESIFQAGASTTFAEVVPILEKISRLSKQLIPDDAPAHSHGNSEDEERALNEFKRTRDDIVREMEGLHSGETMLREQINELGLRIEEKSVQARSADKARYEIMMKKSELASTQALVAVRRNTLEKLEQQFVDELHEATVLTGPQVMSYKGYTVDIPDDSRAPQEDRHRKIERIKIRLEDAGAGGGTEVLKEYQEVTERDTFLSKEVEDLTTSMLSLESLIRELKERLDVEFKTGIEKINDQFQNFFSLMFGGGTAFLSLVAETKRKRKGEEGEDLSAQAGEISDIEAEEEQFEHGIDINVSLPQKKVKELSMLSGGERSLTSIALLFAISQVNPPPFLVLDETDAALDEANSRKYGDMIEKLSHYSQLVVVTHNRETMSRANVLYGVTVGSDGGSKLLSLKFDEAVVVAK